jgi:hypothetical protein
MGSVDMSSCAIVRAPPCRRCLSQLTLARSDEGTPGRHTCREQNSAVTSLHPKKYDSTQSSPSAAERFAVLVGGVITPTGGVGIGASWMAARPVSVNAGLAVLLVNTAKNGKKALDVPTDLASPLKTGVAYGWFVGANYNLGR